MRKILFIILFSLSSHSLYSNEFGLTFGFSPNLGLVYKLNIGDFGIQINSILLKFSDETYDLFIGNKNSFVYSRKERVEYFVFESQTFYYRPKNFEVASVTYSIGGGVNLLIAKEEKATVLYSFSFGFSYSYMIFEKSVCHIFSPIFECYTGYRF